MSHEGYLRHLFIRRATNTKEILINLVTSTQWTYDKSEEEIIETLKDGLLKLNLKGKIVGILHTYNNSVADVVRCDKMNVLQGRDYIYEEILDLKFKIS